MDLGLKGKVALVTGAGSQIGFGKAICLTLAKEGCDIIASDIDFDGTKKTAAEVEALGRKALAVKADVTKKAEVQEMVRQALAKFGKIDILVNCAGIFNDAHRPAGSGPGRNIQVHCLDENPGGWPKIRKFNPQTSSRQIPGSGSGPLAYNPFDPDIVLIYGNPAR
jgi:NAD(P)-dependent dehydrogenase (short-subunit alcohol dehydrogenase family)